jgi:hypothetical protein
MARGGASNALEVISGAPSQVVRRSGRFTARLPIDRILDEIAQVAHRVAVADGDEPYRLTAKEWDRERQALLVTGLPTAETLCQRLRLRWSEVVQAALLAPSKRGNFLAVHGEINVGRYGADGKARAIAALQAVAFEWGPDRKLSKTAYNEIALELESASRRWRNSDPLQIPRSTYLIAQFGSWEAACAAAGLEPDPGGANYAALPTRAEVLDEVITELGCLPARDYFIQLCQSRLISYRDHKERWFVTVNEARRLRALRGETTPLRSKMARELPLLPAVAVRSGGVLIHSKADFIASLRRYATRFLKDGRAPKTRHYTYCCSLDPDLIDTSRMGRYGGFTALCREAGI